MNGRPPRVSIAEPSEILAGDAPERWDWIVWTLAVAGLMALGGWWATGLAELAFAAGSLITSAGVIWLQRRATDIEAERDRRRIHHLEQRCALLKREAQEREERWESVAEGLRSDLADAEAAESAAKARLELRKDIDAKLVKLRDGLEVSIRALDAMKGGESCESRSTNAQPK